MLPFSLRSIVCILGSLHGVQLFPRESCSCSINQRCSHIMAVMMALGMPVVYDRKGIMKVMKPQHGQNDPNNELLPFP